MSSPKTEWDEEIRNFLKTYYEPVSSPIEEDEYTERLSLFQVYRMVKKILPSNYIYEEDVYEALADLDFKIFSYVIPAKYDEETGKEIFPEETAFAYFMNKKTAAL